LIESSNYGANNRANKLYNGNTTCVANSQGWISKTGTPTTQEFAGEAWVGTNGTAHTSDLTREEAFQSALIWFHQTAGERRPKKWRIQYCPTTLYPNGPWITVPNHDFSNYPSDRPQAQQFYFSEFIRTRFVRIQQDETHGNSHKQLAEVHMYGISPSTGEA
jgi:hypothetical protein